MTQKNIFLTIGSVIVLAAAAYLLFSGNYTREAVSQNLDATPQNVTLSGVYECLPHIDTSGPQTMECAFGLRTDDGTYYAVNFGDDALAAQQFQSGARITAEGNVVIKEALSSDYWAKYNMKGIFTVTRLIDPAPAASQGKLNIDAVCNGALAYMSFPDGEAAAKFVADCKAGMHPEVIEQYKVQMGLGDGAAI